MSITKSRPSQSSSRPPDRSAGELEIYLADAMHSPSLLGKKRRLVVKAWSTVADVKRIVAFRLNVPAASQRIFYKEKELKNTHSLQDSGVCRSGELLTWSVVTSASSIIVLEPYGSSKCPKNLTHSMFQGKRALLLGKVPVLSIEGTGGCYFIPDTRGHPVAVFKPRDEEPYMPNNPREAMVWHGDEGMNGEDVRMRHGVGPGGCCYREVAAYLLDTGHFARVPQTTLVKCLHPKFTNREQTPQGPKVGSFQAFACSDGVAEDFSSSKFPADEVHRIALLDIRTLNCDRNVGNLLVRRSSSGGSISLVPIDHGYCLPEVLEIGWCDWCWLDWPQCKEPLSKATLEYVLNVVDPEADAALVKAQFPEIPDSSVCLLKLAGLLLQCGCRAGLSVFDIASLVVRNDCLDDDQSQGARSELERLHNRASVLSSAGSPPPVSADCDGSPPVHASPTEQEQAALSSCNSQCAEKTSKTTNGTIQSSGGDSDSEEEHEHGFWVDDMAVAAKREKFLFATTVDWYKVDAAKEGRVLDSGPRCDGEGLKAAAFIDDTGRKSKSHAHFWRIAEKMLQEMIDAKLSDSRSGVGR
mmetsp:Transcript_91487/g.182336  ORF Transcript_91487/g.182336 Transcript_91487/m.182336 type:complete len:583 (-) Transcript_91487:216-1964(-)